MDEVKPTERNLVIYPLIVSIVVSIMPSHQQLPEAYEHLRAVEILAEQDVCTEWTAVAVEAGWSMEDLPKLFRIMYRESRCIPTACSESDSGRVCRDWGLMQINDYSWKSTIRKLGLEMDYMWDPYWNLWFSKWLYDYSLDRNGDGWQPWKIPAGNP